MPQVDFLEPGVRQIRHQIKGVIESYSHEWDILSELTQNARDAIVASGRSDGAIFIEVDSSRGHIVVSDNGTGIVPSALPELMGPFSTDKDDNPELIGEKGVGLTFVIFSSSYCSVQTRHSSGAATAVVSGANQWLYESSETRLSLDLSDSSPLDVGTRVEVRLPSSHPIFDWDIGELLFILLTRTALGDTGHIWGDPSSTKFTLRHIDRQGVPSERTEPCSYLLPTAGISGNDCISIQQFKAWLKDGDRSDQAKRIKLMNKTVTNSGKIRQGGREVRYWSCFVPNREWWDTLTLGAGLDLPVDTDDDSETTAESDDVESELRFKSGLATSVKGMPTGIPLDIRPKGSAGYVPNFFVLVDDPNLTFDIGRKAIPITLQSMARQVAYENFRLYINSVRKYMSGSLEEDPASWERDEIFNAIAGFPDLDSPHTNFVKRPNRQEATVAAMFFEAMGRGGPLAEIKPMSSGYKKRYDLYARWQNRNIVVEFKYNLFGLFKDFRDERKMFDETNAVVVWEITEADREEAARRGVTVLDMGSRQPRFPAASAELRIDMVNPIFVVEMRRLIGV